MSFSIVQNQSVPSARNVTASGATLAALVNVDSAKAIVVGLQAEVVVVYSATLTVVTPNNLAAAVGLPAGIAYSGFGYVADAGAVIADVDLVSGDTAFVGIGATTGVAKISLFV